jgi:hypothetical protein
MHCSLPGKTHLTGFSNCFSYSISTHAIAAGAVLVTNNPKDFKGIDGLVIENWVTGEKFGRAG